MKRELLFRLYAEMLRIRRAEEAVADEYPKKEMRCPVHLSIGQEAVPVGLCAHLTDEDRVYSTHRCHAHYLAKGGDLNAMIAELFGKRTGCAGGKGGSMHLVDVKRGMMGASALVAGTIPLAVGSALAFAREKTPRVSISFFGDGGTEEGIFYESMNFASLHKLPIIFAVENNLYATYSHQSKRQARPEIHKRGETFNIPGAVVDGNDIADVYEASQVAVARARCGNGPTLLEFQTYRFRDHVGPNTDIEVGYRSQAELDQWLERCPIKRLRDHLIQNHAATPENLSAMENKIADEIERAFAFARTSAVPEAWELGSHLYA